MNFRLFALMGAAVTCLLPASSVAVTPPADTKVPFQVGETLNYDVSWSSFFTAGRATLRVVDRKALDAGHSGYGLQVEARSVSVTAKLHNLYYKIDSVLDASTLAPVSSASYGNEGGQARATSITFGPSAAS